MKKNGKQDYGGINIGPVQGDDRDNEDRGLWFQGKWEDSNCPGPWGNGPVIVSYISDVCSINQMI